MKIRYRILLIIGLIMVCLTGTLYLLTQTVIYDSIAASENAYCSANAQRFVNNLDTSIAALNNCVNDWAKWDDTYQFTQDNDTDFINSNLVDNTFVNLQLNMMLFFDQSGNLVWGKMYDLQNGEPLKMSSEISTAIAEKCLTNDVSQSKQGLILVNGAPMLVAAHAILTSLQQGPNHGILIMGRYLDYDLDNLAISTGLPVSISPIDNPNADYDFRAAAKALSHQTKIYTCPLNETSMAGYTLLEDITGNPIGISRVIDTRVQYSQGKTALAYIAFSFAVIIAFIFFVIAFLLERVVISRLSDLSETVIKIRRTGNNSKRIKVKGHDELASLSEDINGMLDSIDKNTFALESTVKERTKHLVENQKKLESLLLASPDAIIATDIEGYITECNTQVISLGGFDRNYLLGKPALEFMPETACPTFVETLRTLAVENKGSVHFESMFIKKDGSTYPAELSVNLVRDEDDYPVGFVAIIRDLSEKKLLEKRLLKAQRMAAIGELASMVAHDIRNPLAAIRNADFYIKRKCAGCKSEVTPMLDAIDKSIDHANNIVNDLLEYSREPHLNLVECSPKQLLNKALTMIKVPNNIQLIDCTDDTKLKVDENKAVRIYVNLMKNALDAMPEGGTLEVKSSQEQGQVTISFADTGIGISPDALAKLFTPLFTTKAQGMGFGLSISKRFVKAHGGKIWVKSDVGKGTTFTVAFPLQPNVNTDKGRLSTQGMDSALSRYGYS